MGANTVTALCVRTNFTFVTNKPEGRRSLGRSRRRWVDNIEMSLQEVGSGGMEWIELSKDRDTWRALLNAAMKLRVPQNAGIS